MNASALYSLVLWSKVYARMCNLVRVRDNRGGGRVGAAQSRAALIIGEYIR